MISVDELREFYDRPMEAVLADDGQKAAHDALLRALESGEVRAATRHADGTWRAVTWVKQAILVGFRRSEVREFGEGPFPFFDKAAYPTRAFELEDRVRLVPGGTSVRRGTHVAPGVVVMPPAYVNLGAFVGTGTMIDSHALVGSCAQVGERVHLSAGAQLGGVLEPAQATPVVIEDEVFVGALTGVFEGVVVRERAVLASGLVLTSSTVIHDLVHARTWHREVPPGAVVVPGTRPASGYYARANAIALATPVIVKYRDERTDAATALEQALR